MPATTLTLNTTAYTPNWKDPRTLKRVQQVLEWCNATLSETVPRAVRKTAIDAIFGQQQNPLSRLLRARLLVQQGGYKPGAYFYNYTLCEGALEQLVLDIGTGTTLTEVERLRLQWNDTLQTLTFNYNDKADRLWHPLQGLKRSLKRDFWAGHLPYDYDIEACAPTVISQMAERLGMLSLLQESVQDYLQNKDDYRQHVVALTGCSTATAKRLINSLFNGARLARSPWCGAYRALDNDYAAMTALMEDEKIDALRRGIKRVWKHIERETSRRHNVEQPAYTSRVKWGIYFRMERKILNAWRAYLDETGNRHFCEHDGVKTEKPVDIEKLQAHLKKATGFSLRISSTV